MTIGIKIADGSYYTILAEGFAGKKRLVVTTVRDNQSRVEIDFHQGQDGSSGSWRYIGSLVIDNIEPLAKGAPEIEVLVGLDGEGNLEATATDRGSRETQSLSTRLQEIAEETRHDIPEFELEQEEVVTETVVQSRPEPADLTGDAYPVGTTDRRRETFERRRANPVLLVAFVLLALVVVGAVSFIILRGLRGDTVPSLAAGSPPAAAASSAPAVTAPAPAAMAPATSAPAPTTPAPATASPAASPTLPVPAETRAVETRTESTSAGIAVTVKASETSSAPSADAAAKAAAPAQTAEAADGVWYPVRWGDTLWDLAGTYYRNPWYYPRIARANGIKNPDLIISGTRILIPKR